MSEHSQPTHDTPPWPFTAIAAWLVPGLGHYLIGYRRRGLILCITLLSLFTIGLLVGGVSVVDSDREQLWFAGQSLIGPVAPVVNLYRRNREAHLHNQLDEHARRLRSERGTHIDSATVQLDLLERDDVAPAFRRSLGRVNELGILYCTLAGVLNLLVILDVIGRSSSAPIHPAPPPDDAPDDADSGRLVTRDRNAP